MTGVCKRNILVIALLVVTGFAIYANSFGNKMFWDDNDIILGNRFIQDWQYFPKYFSENLIAGANLMSDYWRPMLLTVFSAEWRLWGSWAPGYHIVNASFHIAAAVLLCFILYRIFKNRLLAILTALVFLVHPLQIEAVAYVSGLGDSLSVFFMFLGILLYLKSKRPFHPLSLIAYLFALMSKETAIIMPALIFIADIWSVGGDRNDSFKEKLKKAGKAVLPFLVIAGIYVLLRGTVLNFGDTFNLYHSENVFTSNFFVRLFAFFRVLVSYAGFLFLPFNLHMERNAEIAASFDSFLNPFLIALGGLLFIGLLLLAFGRFKKSPSVSFGIFWFLIGLAPTSNLLVPISGFLYEHWLYLPLIGIFLALIGAGMEIGTRCKKRFVGKILLAIFLAYLVFLSALAVKQNTVWRDPIAFYTYTLAYAPGSYRVTNNLGMAYDEAGDYERAKTTYEKAITLAPDNPVAYHNMGNTYLKMGATDRAIESFRKAIALDPAFVFSYNALAALYAKEGNNEEAQKIIEAYRSSRRP